MTSKWDIIKRINVETKTSQQEIFDIVQKFFNVMVESLIQGEKIIISDFGTFYVKVRKTHKGRNPKHPERGIIIIPDQPRVKFRVSEELEEQVKQLYKEHIK